MTGIAAIVLALAAAVPAAADTTEVLAGGSPRPGHAVPWLAGWTLDDEVWNLAGALEDTTARRTALVFWATWCAPCQDGLARLAAARDRLDQAAVRVVLVNLDARASTVRRFLDAHPVPFLCVLDPFRESSRRFFGLAGDQGQALTLPRTVLVDRRGRVEAVFGREGADYLDLLIDPARVTPRRR
jgi:peroxiredoxin